MRFTIAYEITMINHINIGFQLVCQFGAIIAYSLTNVGLAAISDNPDLNRVGFI